MRMQRLKNQLRVVKILRFQSLSYISYENGLFTRPESFFANGLVRPRQTRGDTVRWESRQDSRFSLSLSLSFFFLFSSASFSPSFLSHFYFHDGSSSRVRPTRENQSICAMLVRPIKHTVAARGSVSQRIKMHASLDTK